MVGVILLVLAQGLPSPVQQQQSAASVYKVFYAVKASGSFTKVVNNEIAVHQPTVERDFAEATAFAVDPDGWLITARHVVDMAQLASEFCKTAEERFTRYRVDSIQLDMSVTDIVGHSWPARYLITPPADSTADVCHSRSPVSVYREEFWPVMVVAVDDGADLGLIKLTQSDGPVAYLQWGTVAGMHQWHPVYAFGFPGHSGLVMRTGLLVTSCEITFGDEMPAPDIGPDVVRIVPELLTRYMLDGKPGMSGGPIVAGEHLVGVTVAAGPTIANLTQGTVSTDFTFAVPVDYVHAWYLWVRGITSAKPSEVCVPVLVAGS